MKGLHYFYLSICMWAPLYSSDEPLFEDAPSQATNQVTILPYVPEGHVIYPKPGDELIINNRSYTVGNQDHVTAQSRQEDIIYPSPGDILNVKGSWYRVGHPLDTVAATMAQADLTQESLAQAEKVVAEIQKQESIPLECRREIELVLQEKQDQFALHQHNKGNFFTKNQANIAKIAAFRALHPGAANVLVAQNMSQEGKESIEKVVADQKEKAQHIEQQKESESPQELEEKEEFTPVQPLPSPEEVEEVIQELQKDVDGQKEIEKEIASVVVPPVPLSSEQELLEPVYNPEVTAQLNDFLERIIEEVMASINIIKPLHAEVYKSCANRMQATQIGHVLVTIAVQSKPLFDVIYAELKLQDMQNWPQETQEKQEELQLALNVYFSYILVMFDALIAGVVDEKEKTLQKSQSSGFWGWFGGGKSEEQQRKDQVLHFRNIKQALDDVGESVVSLISMCELSLADAMESFSLFESHRFDVLNYAKVKNTAGTYIYSRTGIKNDEPIIFINEFHRKKDAYKVMLETYQKGINTELKNLGASLATSVDLGEKTTKVPESAAPEPTQEEPKKEVADQPTLEEKVEPAQSFPSEDDVAEILKSLQESTRTPKPKKPLQEPVKKNPVQPDMPSLEQEFAEQEQPSTQAVEASAEDIAQLNGLLGSINNELSMFIQSLQPIHQKVYAAYSKRQEAAKVALVLGSFINSTLPLLKDLYQVLQRTTIRNWPQETQDAQQQFQKRLNVSFAYILVQFDALIAGLFDEKEKAFKEANELVSSGFFGFSSREKTLEEKKQIQITHFRNIKQVLDDVGPNVVALINIFIKVFATSMNTFPIFENSAFNVMNYAQVTASGGKYLYGRTSTRDEEKEKRVIVNEFHRKKDSYAVMLDSYQTSINKALQDLGASLETSVIIKPSYVELDETKKGLPELEVPAPMQKEIEKTIEEIQAPEPIAPVVVPPQEPEIVAVEEKPEPTKEEPQKEPEAPEEFVPFEPREELEEEIVEEQEPPLEEETPVLEEEIASEEQPLPEQSLAKEYADLDRSIADINTRTQELKTAQAQSEVTWSNLMFSDTRLNELLAPTTFIRMGEANEEKKEEAFGRLSTAFTDYANQLVAMACIEAKIGDYTLATLHSFVHQHPFELQVAYDHVAALSTLAAVTKTIDTLSALATRGISLQLWACDKMLGLMSAIFDACASGLMNQDILQQQQATYETYNQAVELASTFASAIEALHDSLIIYYSSETLEAYQASTLDITTLVPELMQNDVYIYAVAADIPFTIDAITLQTVAIDALHQKEYATVLEPLKNVLDLQDKLTSLKAVTHVANLTLEEIAKYLADLEEVKESMDPQEYEDLKSSLEAQQTSLNEASIALDDLLAEFAEKIKKARSKLADQQPVITMITFETYTTVQGWLDENPILKSTYGSKVEEMVTLFETYLTEAVQAMIRMNGLNTLHINVQKSTQQAREAIQKAINSASIERIHAMLMQLKEDNLFGVDSTADYKIEVSRKLQKALIQGYAYILVAYDALEATLYENFSTREKIAQWAQYILTVGDQGNETLYDKAITTLDTLMNVLNKARTLYFNQLIDPFFEGAGSYKDVYDKGALDVRHLDLENILNQDGTYRYIQPDISDIYKGQLVFMQNAAKGLHKRDYDLIPQYWKSYLADAYAPELLEKKQITLVEDIQSTFPSFVMQDYIDYLTHNRDMVSEELRQHRASYSKIATRLQELAGKNAITPDIQRELQKSFEFLLGMYDGLFAHIYDLVKQQSIETDQGEKNYILKHIAVLIKTVGVALVDVIESFEQQFTDYLSPEFITKFKNKQLFVGADIGAVKYLDQKHIEQRYIFERPANFAKDFPSKGFFQTDAQYATAKAKYIHDAQASLVVNDKKRTFYVPENHARNYREFLENWNPIVQAILIQVAPDEFVYDALALRSYGDASLSSLPQLITTDPTSAQQAIQAMKEEIPFVEIQTILAQAGKPLPEMYQQTLNQTTQALLDAYQATQPFDTDEQTAASPQGVFFNPGQLE